MDRAADQPATTAPTDYSEIIMQRELLREATQRLLERLQAHNPAERPQCVDAPEDHRAR